MSINMRRYFEQINWMGGYDIKMECRLITATVGNAGPAIIKGGGV